MVICLERGADLHMAQLMPLPLTVSCSSKIRIGFTFLVSAHPGSPGQRAVKRVCVCVCVCVCSFPISATIRYDTRCYFNVRSKANMSRSVSLIYRTEPTTKKCKSRRKKTKSRKQICSEITVNSGMLASDRRRPRTCVGRASGDIRAHTSSERRPCPCRCRRRRPLMPGSLQGPR